MHFKHCCLENSFLKPLHLAAMKKKRDQLRIIGLLEHSKRTLKLISEDRRLSDVCHAAFWNYYCWFLFRFTNAEGFDNRWCICNMICLFDQRICCHGNSIFNIQRRLFFSRFKKKNKRETKNGYIRLMSKYQGFHMLMTYISESKT